MVVSETVIFQFSLVFWALIQVKLHWWLICGQRLRSQLSSESLLISIPVRQELSNTLLRMPEPQCAGNDLKWVSIFWRVTTSGNEYLGGGFKYFLFSRLFGEDSHFGSYFSNRLVQPPSRYNLSSFYNSCLLLVSFPVQVLHWIFEVEGDRFTRTSPQRVEGSYFEWHPSTGNWKIWKQTLVEAPAGGNHLTVELMNGGLIVCCTMLLLQTLYCSLLTAWHAEAGQAGLKSVMNATWKSVKPKVEALTALSTHIRQDGAM